MIPCHHPLIILGCLIVFCCHSARSKVTDIMVSDLAANSDLVEEAITTQGVFTLKGLSSRFTTAYLTLANDLPECGTATEKDSRTERLGDGTLRTTYAQKSMQSSSRFLQSSSCPSRVVNSVNYIRHELDYLGHEVAQVLDKVLSFDTSEDEVIRRVEDILLQGRDSHLDHIHVYTKNPPLDGGVVGIRAPPQQEEEENTPGDEIFDDTLTLHIDQGAFLLLVLPPGDSNLYYEDGLTGKQVPLNIPLLDDDVKNEGGGGKSGMRVVVLMGNTLRGFIGTTPSVRPLPHVVRMKTTTESNNPARLVFGRMFLLPQEYRSPLFNDSVTFKQWAQAGMMPDDNDSDEVAFSKRKLAAECKAGEIFCWMQCMANTCDNDNEMPVCWDKATNALCPTNDGIHHKTCGVECALKPAGGNVGSPVSPTPDPNAFCTGSTAMFMDGFNWMRGPTTQCVILFTSSWVLDTAWKFALGCIGVVFLGMLVEGILWARRRYLHNITHTWLHAIVGSLAFGLSISIAYLAMLVVMTYSCELFLCLCAGLVMGHFIFGNVRVRIGEAPEPCCGDTIIVTNGTSSETERYYPNESAKRTIVRKDGCCDTSEYGK